MVDTNLFQSRRRHRLRNRECSYYADSICRRHDQRSWDLRCTEKESGLEWSLQGWNASIASILTPHSHIYAYIYDQFTDEDRSEMYTLAAYRIESIQDPTIFYFGCLLSPPFFCCPLREAHTTHNSQRADMGRFQTPNWPYGMAVSVPLWSSCQSLIICLQASYMVLHSNISAIQLSMTNNTSDIEVTQCLQSSKFESMQSLQLPQHLWGSSHSLWNRLRYW